MLIFLFNYFLVLMLCGSLRYLSICERTLYRVESYRATLAFTDASITCAQTVVSLKYITKTRRSYKMLIPTSVRRLKNCTKLTVSNTAVRAIDQTQTLQSLGTGTAVASKPTA